MLASQEERTFFVTTNCYRQEALFRSPERAALLLEVLQENRGKGRFLLHEFVIMPEHLHAILTPAPEVSLEKAMQFIKGAFSFRVKKELGFRWDVWRVARVGLPLAYPGVFACALIRVHPPKSAARVSLRVSVPPWWVWAPSS